MNTAGPHFTVELIIPLISFVMGMLSIPIYELVRMKFNRPHVLIEFDATDENKRYVYKSKWLEQHEIVCHSCYIRVFVSNPTSFVAKSCKAYLTSIEFWDEATEQYKIVSYDPIELTWSHHDSKGVISLPPYFGRFCDLIFTRSDRKRMHISSDWQIYMFDEIFEKIGKYKFSIMVVGENIKPKKFSITLAWDGHWSIKNENVHLGEYTPNILLSKY